MYHIDSKHTSILLKYWPLDVKHQSILLKYCPPDVKHQSILLKYCPLDVKGLMTQNINFSILFDLVIK
jgi:hypothetical protein